jgi:hypothetical protein
MHVNKVAEVMDLLAKMLIKSNKPSDILTDSINLLNA